MGRKKAVEFVSPIDKVKNWCADERVKFIFSMFLFLLSIVMLIGFVSFLFTWKADQAKFEIGIIRYLCDSDIQVSNWGSKLGAVLAHVFIHNWFGIPSFSFIFLCLLWACKIIKYEPLNFKPIVKNTLIWTVWSSVFLAFLFGDDFFFLGGVFGYETAYWLESVIGKVGTLLLLLIAAGAILMTTFENSLGWTKVFVKDFKDNKNLKKAVHSANSYITKVKENIQNPQSSFENASKRKSNVQPDFDSPVYDEDEGGILNAPVNTAPNQTSVKESAKSFFRDIFKGKDYKGQQQQIPFDKNSQQQKSENQTNNLDSERFILTDDGKKQSLNSDLDFEVEDTMQKDEVNRVEDIVNNNDSEQEVTETQSSDTLSDENEVVNSNPNPNPNPTVTDNQQMPLEVEVHHDVAVEDISNLPPYDPTQELSDYRLPPVDLLDKYETGEKLVNKSELIENKTKIVEALKNFNIKINKIKAAVGPTVTLYEITPAPGIRISKIKGLEDDIQLSLEALGIRIIAPMPGKGTVGIEVPNKKPAIVSMESLIVSPQFQESKYELPIALGKTIDNNAYVMDLTKCPHLLVAGATGQGKSVGLNAIIASILYKKHPAEVKFVLVDPKKVELTLYNNIEKHYLAKLPESEEAIITDVDKVKETLNSLTVEMTNRYDLLKIAKTRNIKEYNAKFISRHLNPNNGHRFLPYIVVIIDEFADLIMTAGKEIEKPIARIAQLARAIGIHLIVATQRPTTNIITGLIKANFPTRIAFKVSSMMDSRTILDTTGANHLIGRGDMLISNGSELTRLQCAFIDTPELEKITEYIGSQKGYPTTYELPEPDIEASDGSEPVDLSKRDSLFEEAARMVVLSQQGSTSMLQRKFQIGYNRAGRIMDQLEAASIVGPSEGSKARNVLIDSEYTLEQYLSDLDRSV
ncbi:MAG: DNA translocase FtsK 4TM domain-containing protein [Bacteroidales bacterium]|nr:DNA translocase FtsK 4TM domain-containing protein [Bacteroidales bacterium]